MPAWRCHRYNVHIVAYSGVAAFLIIMGCIFSAFAIFEKKSVIAQVWLAGPTTIAVGLVLVGKVIIDCRPTAPDPDEDLESLEDETAFGPDDVRSQETLPGAAISSELKKAAERDKGILIANMNAKLEEGREKRKINSFANCETGTRSSSTASEVWSLRTDLPPPVACQDCLCLQNQNLDRLPSSLVPTSPVPAQGSIRLSNNSPYRPETFLIHEVQYHI